MTDDPTFMGWKVTEKTGERSDGRRGRSWGGVLLEVWKGN